VFNLAATTLILYMEDETILIRLFIQVFGKHKLSTYDVSYIPLGNVSMLRTFMQTTNL